MEAKEGQVILPKAEFIDDVEQYMEGKSVDTVIAGLNEQRRRWNMVENQIAQKKARLMTKLPEIQKALDIVKALIEKGSADMVLDYELAEGVYAKTRVSSVQTVNLWLGANVMVEYSLQEAQELLSSNMEACKINMKSAESDLELIKDNITTIDVSISRIWNYGIELKRKEKQ